MRHLTGLQAHMEHVILHGRTSHAQCPECRADHSRRFAVKTPFKYAHVHEYLTWVRPRIEAIRAGVNGGDTVNARIWQRDFVRALHNRISSHIPETGRKHAPDYAKYHMSSYGNDYRYIHAL